MATIKEVAKMAGVSIGTVSNVLNHVPSVKQQNRKKVIEACEQLNYTPNIVARTLKTNVSKSIGLIIPDITNPIYPEIARGVEDTAKRHGYTIFLCNADRSIYKEREYFQVLVEKSVDGIVILKPYITIDEIRNMHDKCKIVIVDMGNEIIKGFDQVNIDDYSGVMQAMNLLYQYGHNRIAFISGFLECKAGYQRQRAYIDFLKSKNIEIDELLIKRGSYDWHSGYKCTMKLLRQVDPPTAIFASNDLMAIGALKAIREKKLSIPKDISVVGSDDIDMASLCTPQLTTIARPKYEVGARSVELLIELLDGNNNGDIDKHKIITLQTELIIRESVGPA